MKRLIATAVAAAAAVGGVALAAPAQAYPLTDFHSYLVPSQLTPGTYIATRRGLAADADIVATVDICSTVGCRIDPPRHIDEIIEMYQVQEEPMVVVVPPNAALVKTQWVGLVRTG